MYLSFYLVSYYYYAIAKDFEANLVALQASMDHPEDDNQQFYLKHEQVDSLPKSLQLSKNATHNLQNVILFRIELHDLLKKSGENHII